MNPALNRKRGKRHQKRIADMLSGVNLGTLGKVDVLTDRFSIECKSRVAFVGFKWYEQAKKYSDGRKIPIVIVHKKNGKYNNDLVIMSLEDFKKEVFYGALQI